MTRALEGRGVVVTGASQGLGRAIARACVAAGAHVVICARTADGVEDAQRELANLARRDQRILAAIADVSNREDVERLASLALSSLPQVHALVNNAGVYGPLGPVEVVDWDAWKHAIAVNLDGSVLPCRAFVPHFKKNRYGKIIQLSGGGATNPLPNISAYAASKAAVVRFAETIAEELRDYSVDVNSVAPGLLDTRLLDEVVAAGPERVGATFHKRMVEQKAKGGNSLDSAADLVVFLASAASDGITGKLLSAVWDPWRELPSHLHEIDKADIYTLRRIVPKDRGLGWGG